MPASVRPRRSILFMPGSNRRALEKARGLAADGCIFDLEDAVAPDAKVLAREQVAAAVAEGGYCRREILVRVNGLTTTWGEADVAAARALVEDYFAQLIERQRRLGLSPESEQRGDMDGGFAGDEAA